MSGRIPHIVQYQGSKRLLAPQILQYMPMNTRRLVEPFSGMSAISIAAACQNRANHFHLNDINAPIIGLLREAIENPDRLLYEYSRLWEEQFLLGDNHIAHFYAVRDRFNDGEETPANMLYLLARCVKGSIRYGRNGKFNQSPDKRRHGTSPKTLEANIYEISDLLKGKTTFTTLDHHDIFDMSEQGDLLYMDPRIRV